MTSNASLCPCNSGQPFDSCCGPLLAGSPAPTAEALMRSRYTAYVKGNVDYIEQTCAKKAREEFNRADVEGNIDEMEWQGIDILRVTEGGAVDAFGTVDFSFHFKHKGNAHTQREIASFEKIDGRWYYIDSDFNPKGETVHITKIGRNDPCPCGSNKKYKKCCGV